MKSKRPWIRALFSLCALSAACREQPRAPMVQSERTDAAVSASLDVAIADGRASDVGDALVADASEPLVMPLPDAPTSARREEANPVGCIEDRGSAGRVELPQVPPELRADVSRYRLVVAHAMRCFEGYRVEHVRAPDCRAAVTTLTRGGAAAMHALGQFAYDEQRRQLTQQERAATRVAVRFGGLPRVAQGGGSIFDAAATIAPIMATFDAPEVVPYILAALEHYARCRLASDFAVQGFVRWIEPLGSVTGWDLTPLPPWQLDALTIDQADQFAGDAYVNWVRWYRAHKNESLAQWRAQGTERARRALTGRAIPTRVAAIIRFFRTSASPDDREAARRSLTELLDQRRVSNEGRRFLRTLAEPAATTR